MGDIFSICNSDSPNAIAMGCQNGIFYVRINSLSQLEPLGNENSFLKLQVFWLSPTLSNSAYLAISSSVGESETHESVSYNIYIPAEEGKQARVKKLMVVRTTVQQQSQFQVFALPNDERFLLTVVTPWLRLLDTAKGKVYTLGEIENYS